MYDAATASPETASPDAPRVGAVPRQVQLLGELAELGLDIARAIARQASGQSVEAVVEGDVALAYARVSRAVRLTLMLQAKLIEEFQAAADEAAEVKARLAPAYRAKARVEAIVERVAESAHDEDTVDRLISEAAERLDDEDLYGDLLERPLSELVARICKDLGLEPDWAELAGELWAVREVRSGEVGWPLAGPRLSATSPAYSGRGGPFADPGKQPGEERMVERARGELDFSASPIRNSS
jgi:hypothetical protein